MTIILDLSFDFQNKKSIYSKAFYLNDLIDNCCSINGCTNSICFKCNNLSNFYDFLENYENLLPFRNKPSWFLKSSKHTEPNNLLTTTVAKKFSKNDIWHIHYYESFTYDSTKITAKYLTEENYPGLTSGFLIFYKKISHNHFEICFCSSHPSGATEWAKLNPFVK